MIELTVSLRFRAETDAEYARLVAYLRGGGSDGLTVTEHRALHLVEVAGRRALHSTDLPEPTE